jgi:hypothetical protein
MTALIFFAASVQFLARRVHLLASFLVRLGGVRELHPLLVES